MEYHKFSCPFQLYNLENGCKHFNSISFAAEPDTWRVRPGMLIPPRTTTPTPRLPSPFPSPPSLPLPSIALLSSSPSLPCREARGSGKERPSGLQGRAPAAKAFWVHFEPKSRVWQQLFWFFFSAKKLSWYNIINRQRQNAASLTPIPQTQWLLSPQI